MEKKYLVTLDIEARYEVEVQARDQADAETQALDVFDRGEAVFVDERIATALEEIGEDDYQVTTDA